MIPPPHVASFSMTFNTHCYITSPKKAGNKNEIKLSSVLTPFSEGTTAFCVGAQQHPNGIEPKCSTSKPFTYLQCLCGPLSVSMTKHSPPFRQYARSFSWHGLKCSECSGGTVGEAAGQTKKLLLIITNNTYLFRESIPSPTILLTDTLNSSHSLITSPTSLLRCVDIIHQIINCCRKSQFPAEATHSPFRGSVTSHRRITSCASWVIPTRHCLFAPRSVSGKRWMEDG